MGLCLGLLPLQGGTAAVTAVALCVLLLVVAGITRLRTAWISRSQLRHDLDVPTASPTAKLPPLIPYWFPILGHIPNFIFGRGKFLPSLRDSLPHGVASLNILGTTHVFIFRHSIGSSLLSKPGSAADAGWFRTRMLNKGFGYPIGELDAYAAMAPKFNDLYTRNLLSGPGLARMVAGTAERLAYNIDRFVTLTGDPTDDTKRTPWEQVASVKSVGVRPETPYSDEKAAGDNANDDEDPAVEASLEDLVRAFVGFNANPGMLGDDFMENFPHFWDLLWEFNQSWILLVLGLPRWLPSFLAPRATFARAAAVQAEMLRCVRELEMALDRRAAGEDPGPRWRRLDSVSDLVRARVALYRERGTSIEARAANELGLVWGMNINANMLVFWMVARVAADPALLAGVRQEVAPYLDFPGADNGQGQAARQRHIDVEGLCARCPLLKAAYVESLRIDNSSWDFRRARQDLVLTDRRDGDGAPVAKWLVPKGAYAHVVEEMHHTDPRVFPDPFTWSHHRHITVEDQVPVAKLGLVRPYGGGSSMCPGRTFALRETMAFAAAILHQYNIRPVKTKPDGSWMMPVPEPSSVGIKTLKEPFRVVVRRRKF